MNLVTGAHGFIGSHLVRHLLAENRAVREFDSVPALIQYPHAPEHTFVRADLRDSEALCAASAGCRLIFHQAALVSVPESIAAPFSCNEINITGTLNVLLAAQDTGVERVVVASSSAVYGNDPTTPKRESMLPAPVSPYAASKLAGEHYCQVFHQSYGLSAVALRYFNVFGPGQSPASPYAAVIPKFIDAMIDEREPVIFGDGQQTRDFVFVDDVVQANVLAAEAPNVSGEVFNIGAGTQISLNALLETIAGILGVTPRAQYRPAREGDVRHSVADISKARSLLGFEPKTTLEDGLRQTVEWFVQQKGS